jgi:hypothetical protein
MSPASRPPRRRIARTCSGRPVRAAAAAVLLLAVATGCVPPDDPASPSPASSPAASPAISPATSPGTTTAPPGPGALSGPVGGDWSAPGLVDRTGAPVEVPEPGPASGASRDVTDVGADPAPESGDDAEAIRAALAAAEPGDEVVLPAGTFDLRSTDPGDPSTNLVLRSGIDLRGAGRDRTVLVTSLEGEKNSRVLRGAGIEDVAVTGLAITSRYDGPLGEDPDDGEAGGGPMVGIQLGPRDGQGCARILVEDVAVSRYERHGISVKASREVTLRGNHLAEATGVGPGGKGYGIVVEAAVEPTEPGSPTDSLHQQVVGNTFDGTHLRHAILLQFATHHNLVADNVITGSVLDAIDLHGEGEYLNEIRGNTVTDGRRAGIALGNGGGSTHQHDASGPGNWVHENTLVGNREGVLVILGTPGTVVEGNTILAGTGSTAGIEVGNGPGTVVRGNTITGGTPGFWAVLLVEDQGSGGRGQGVPSGVVIEGNTVRQAEAGIRVEAGEDVTVADNDFEGVAGEELRVDEGAAVDTAGQQ